MTGSPPSSSPQPIVSSTCRFCAEPLDRTFVDLGTAPPCQSQVAPDELGLPERFYPLHARVCASCFLVQIDDVVPPDEIFHTGDYAYFSSYSTSWLAHAERYVADIVPRLGLDETSRVVEIASNDGYLLQYFVQRGIPALGVDPASNCAEAAKDKHVDTLVDFFGRDVGSRVRAEFGPADLILGNNVLAHVPDINDLVGGMANLLSERGTITMEFPHLMRLVDENQFDTIYHEHYSYLGLLTVEQVFAAHGLELFDVEELSTHGGSLRIFARHADDDSRPPTTALLELERRERELGMDSLAYYDGFGEQVAEVRRRLLAFLIEARDAGKSVVGYGAPGKGNTLLNYCGIRTDLLEYTVDRSPHKQGHYTPGMRIPVHAPEKIFETRPDYVLILPWNLSDEITTQMAGVAEWGGRFVVPIPTLRVLDAVPA